MNFSARWELLGVLGRGMSPGEGCRGIMLQQQLNQRSAETPIPLPNLWCRSRAASSRGHQKLADVQAGSAQICQGFLGITASAGRRLPHQHTSGHPAPVPAGVPPTWLASRWLGTRTRIKLCPAIFPRKIPSVLLSLLSGPREVLLVLLGMQLLVQWFNPRPCPHLLGISDPLGAWLKNWGMWVLSRNTSPLRDHQ